jgi:hypothetical protein
MKKLILIASIILNLPAGQISLKDGACTSSNTTDNEALVRLRLAAEIENLLYFIDDNKLINFIIYNRNERKNIDRSDFKSLDFVNSLKQGFFGDKYERIKSYSDRIQSRITKLDFDVKFIKATPRDLDFLLILESLLTNLRNNIQSSKIRDISESARNNFTRLVDNIVSNLCAQYQYALKSY